MLLLGDSVVLLVLVYRTAGRSVPEFVSASLSVNGSDVGVGVDS